MIGLEDRRIYVLRNHWGPSRGPNGLAIGSNAQVYAEGNMASRQYEMHPFGVGM